VTERQTFQEFFQSAAGRKELVRWAAGGGFTFTVLFWLVTWLTGAEVPIFFWPFVAAGGAVIGLRFWLWKWQRRNSGP
jgi:hypothetical protein